jgi:hypothetical protein
MAGPLSALAGRTRLNGQGAHLVATDACPLGTIAAFHTQRFEPLQRPLMMWEKGDPLCLGHFLEGEGAVGTLSKLTISGCSYDLDASGHRVFHVSSPHALLQAVGYLKHTAEPWERIFLRGQSRLYDSFAPTLYRGLSNKEAQGKRHERMSKVIREIADACPLFQKTEAHAQEPLLQHYGIKTTWLDIVDNVWVALWFALHRVSVSGPEHQYMHFDLRSHPDDGEFGYILLIKTEDSRKEKIRRGSLKGKTTEVIDLRIAAPSVFLRPHAQHGLLFRARAVEGGRLIDYSGAIAGIIRFPLILGKTWLGTGEIHNVRSLFPPPFFDKGYQILLGATLSERSIGVITHVGA